MPLVFELGEHIVANRKYKDPVRFEPYAKLIFSTNPLPRFNDTSLGIWRRMIIIPFNYVVPDSHVDVHLLDKLWNTYKRWCRAYGLSKLKPLHSFVKDVLGFMPNIQYPRVKNGMAGDITLHGIELKTGLQFEAAECGEQQLQYE